MTRTWQDNAEEFGALIKQGKDIRLALLVACSVEKGVGDRSKPRVANATRGKVSARDFAQVANTSTDRVLRHLNAWDSAGLPKSAELSPDDATNLTLTDEQVEAFNGVPLGKTATDAIRYNTQAVADLLATDPDFVMKVVSRNAAVVSAVMGCELVTPEQFLEGLTQPDGITAETIAEAIQDDPAIADILAANPHVRAKAVQRHHDAISKIKADDGTRRRQQDETPEGPLNTLIKLTIATGELTNAFGLARRSALALAELEQTGVLAQYYADDATAAEALDILDRHISEGESALTVVLTALRYARDVVANHGPVDIDAGIRELLGP